MRIADIRSWLAFTLLAATLAACGSAPPRRSAFAEPRSVGLMVTSARPTPRGRVVWAWLEGPDFDAYAEHELTDALFVRLIEALHVSEPVELGPEPLEVDRVSARGPGGFVVAFQPPNGHVWETLLGHPADGSAFATAALSAEDEDAVRVRLSAAPSHPPAERCSGPRRQLVLLEVPEVAGAIGNDTTRRLCVMLPEDYERNTARRYPVVFLLPGYGGSDTTYMHLADDDPPAILVGVDGRTRFGTTYFYDTAYAGAWEHFIARAVAEIDQRFRTVADPRSRGLLGHSTGGFNAISLAIRRTDLFTAAAASSPDALDLESWLFTEGRANPTFLQWTRVEDQTAGAGQMVSYAVQFDEAAQPGAIPWPFDLATGVRDDAVWARWRRASPIVMLDDHAAARRVRENLAGRIFVSVGRHDAFGLFAPAERFHRRLDALEIEHVWAPTEGNHFEGSQERRAAGLAFLLQRL